MAKRNNPPVGTMQCVHCEGTRSVHMYESGRNAGKFYTRCPSCPETSHKFISRLGVAEQALVRQKTTFKPGFEQLAETVTPTLTPEPLESSRVEEKSEPQKPQTDDPKPQAPPTPKGKGGLMVMAVVGLFITAIGAMSI